MGVSPSSISCIQGSSADVSAVSALDTVQCPALKCFGNQVISAMPGERPDPHQQLQA